MQVHPYDLHGRNALITGAAGLLGFEHAMALLECGCSVILTDIDPLNLNHTKNKLCTYFSSENIYTYEMDVTSEGSIQSVCDAITNLGLSLDILINNAAIDPKVEINTSSMEFSRLENFPINQWDLQISVGLTGAFLCSKIFGLMILNQGHGGVILNIASDLSVIAPDQRIYRKPGLKEQNQPVKPVTYSVIKTGLVGLTRYLASYWADKGIRSNSLSPGGIYNNQPEEFVQRLVDLIPMGRMAEKSEYRSAIQFLCSDASKFMNGQNIVIDGGRSIL